MNSGLALTHSLGHTLGAMFHVHHGVSVGLVTPYALQFYCPVTDKYLSICKALDIRTDSKEKSFAGLIERIRDLIRSLDLPTDFKSLGITQKQFEDRLDTMVLYASEDTSAYGSPRPVTPEQNRKLLEYAYEGKDVDF